MKNILFVSHSDFPANSAVHIHHFANELIKLGLDCVVTVPHNKGSISSMEENLYKVTQFDDIENLANLFNNQQPPDVVHAWTPREHVRIYCYNLSIHHEFKLVIHLEDNEESVTERFLDVSLKNWSSQYDRLLPYNLSHPVKYKEFMATADGVTVIIDKLKEFTPATIPVITLYPGVAQEKFYPQSKNTQFLRDWGISDDTNILVYTGNVHLANIDEVRRLYFAVGKLNEQGKPTVLIRTGIDNNLKIFSSEQQWMKKYIIELGWIDRDKIPEILALADVLIQPGESDDFNDYRFPSKIPEFLAMGKPIIIPKTNIGEVLTHEQNALILDSVDENTLPEMIDLVLNNPNLIQELTKNGLQFVQDKLNWTNNGKKLFSFYQLLWSEEKTITTLHNSLTRAKLSYHELQEEYCQSETNYQQLNNQYQQLLNDYQGLNQENQRLIDNEQELQNRRELYQKSQNRIQQLEAEINGMKSSKLWKIREKWFRIKGLWNSKLRT